MRILVTGANGFLGQHLVELLHAKGFDILATGRGSSRLAFPGADAVAYQPLDFTDSSSTLDNVKAFHPDTIIHTAAMSKPDDCALQPELAYEVNTKGTVHLLDAAAACKSQFVFLSTDFVFDGQTGMYRESDIPAPVNFYGTTKWEAEKKVQAYPHNWSIVRTVLVYGPNYAGKKNIIDVVKEKLQKGEPYSVVNDQLRTPTFVKDLALGISLLLEKNASGIFHLAGQDRMTPYEMACKVAARLQLDAGLLQPVHAGIFREPAQRPLKTGLDITKAKDLLGYQPLSFSEGLDQTLVQK